MPGLFLCCMPPEHGLLLSPRGWYRYHWNGYTNISARIPCACLNKPSLNVVSAGSSRAKAGGATKQSLLRLPHKNPPLIFAMKALQVNVGLS